jgi:ATP-binding cassette subfamily F protein 3
MILLAVENVTKHFGPEPVLDGVSFEIRPGDKAGLVGPNGAGKSTLLKIVAGHLEADSGQVVRHSSASIAFLEQHPDFEPGATLLSEARRALAALIELQHEAESLAQQIADAPDEAERKKLSIRFDHVQHELEVRDAYHLDRKIERVLEGLGFARSGFHQPVDQLSGGQQNRLLLAKLLLAEPDLMLLDEPSNHLDIEATQWLESFLAASRQAVLLVSHDRYFLDKVTNKTLELFHSTVDSYVGNFSAYWRQKAERVEVERRAFDKQQEFIEKTEEFIRRNSYGQKSAQAEDRRKKLDRVERVDPPREIQAPPMGFPAASRTGDIVLRVEHLSKSFDRPLFQDLSFDVLRGERWGILGPNGTGKTTLLRCLVGEERPTAGEVILGTGVRIGYYDQRLSGVEDDAEVVEAVRPPRKEFNIQQRRDLLARFGVTGDMVFQKVKSLSGGERSKTALARLAAQDVNVLILDEPTNHLDLWSRDALEKALTAFDGTVIMVSHDRYFLNRAADHVLVVEPNRFRVVDGNYDAYLYLTRQGESASNGAAKSTPSGDKKPAPVKTSGTEKRKRRFPYRKVEDLERDIFEREQRIEALHHEMTQPEVLRDGNEVRRVQNELSEQQAKLASLYEHWEEATELN